MTRESLAVSRRVARDIFKKSRQGELDLAACPLLVHVNDVLEQGKDARLPWASFPFDHSAG